MSAEFVANMEDVLDLYAEPYDPQRPVVCFDETSTQLLAGLRIPAGGYPQPVLGLRALGGLARGGGHGAAHDARLRPPDALAGG